METLVRLVKKIRQQKPILGIYTLNIPYNQRKPFKTGFRFFIQLRKVEHVFAEHLHLQLLPIGADPILPQNLHRSQIH